jgi:tetratricopeptide (TPR) repeat protein
LGSIYRELGRLEDAKRVLSKAVSLADSFKGDDVIKSVNPLLALCAIYEKLGQLDDAERVADQALRITESKLARISRAQGYTLMAMGRVQVKQNHVDIGKFSLEEARRIFEREENRRSDPAGLIAASQELAACCLAGDDKAQAIELYRQAVGQCRELVARADNINTRALLASAIKQQLSAMPGDSADAKKEAGALENELRQLLEEFRKAHALSADNEKWLKELGA